MICLLVFSLFASAYADGPVNSYKSFPIAAVSQHGDVLAVGDSKILVTWKGNFSTSRTSASRFSSLNPSEPDRFSGGLVHIQNPHGPAAVACSDFETRLFYPSRSAANPGGYWKSVETSFEKRICAITTDGDYGIYYPSLQKLVINANTSIFFNINIDGKLSDLVASGSRFIVLSNSGIAQVVFKSFNFNWQVSNILSHPFSAGFWSDNVRFHANSRYVIKSDHQQLNLIALNPEFANKSSSALGLSISRLPVSACDDKEVCPPFISEKDDSWSVTGFWGHYLGVGQSFVRLNLIMSSNGRAGVAFAHQGLEGKMIYLGNDDGDTGHLPPLSLGKTPPIKISNDTRWFVWEKTTNGTSTAVQVMFRNNSSQVTDRYLNLKIVENLPATIPSSWGAWEPENNIPKHSSKLGDFGIKLPFFKPSDSDAFAAGSNPWWPKYLGVEEAWALVTAANITPSLVKMGVVDTGVLTKHVALEKQLFIKSAEIAGNGLDDDDNGLVDDTIGYDFSQEDADPTDVFGHGTHVAGLMIGFEPSVGLLAPASKNSRLLSIRALDQYGKSNSIDLARALIYAMEEDVEIINCSWGGGGVTQALKDVFAEIKRRGTLVFSSSGNDGINTDPPNSPEVPKNFEGVISIGAISATGSIPKFSNFGNNTVHLLAPGDKILSSTVDGKYGVLSGTSMASPVAVSAFGFIYGILKSKCKTSECPHDLHRLQKDALDILCKSASKKGVEGRSKCGIISVVAATRLALSWTP